MNKTLLFFIILVLAVAIAGLAIARYAEAPVADSSPSSVASSSPARQEIEEYVKSTDDVPNPNDFNDSYSDLNQ